MEQDRFSIVFTKLAEAITEEAKTKESPLITLHMQAEIDEIAELRRIVLETTEPERKSYTTT